MAAQQELFEEYLNMLLEVIETSLVAAQRSARSRAGAHSARSHGSVPRAGQNSNKPAPKSPADNRDGKKTSADSVKRVTPGGGATVPNGTVAEPRAGSEQTPVEQSGRQVGIESGVAGSREAASEPLVSGLESELIHGLRDALKPPTFAAPSADEWKHYVPLTYPGSTTAVAYLNLQSPLINEVLPEGSSKYGAVLDVGGALQATVATDKTGQRRASILSADQVASVLEDSGWVYEPRSEVNVEGNQPAFVTGHDVLIGSEVPEVVISGGSIEVANMESTRVRVLGTGIVNGQLVNRLNVVESQNQQSVVPGEPEVEVAPFTAADFHDRLDFDEYGMDY